MARKLRYIPDPPTLVSITCRTIQGRFLFKPGPAFNDRFLGILGRAQRRHEMVLNAVSTLSNHFHLLAVPESANQLAAFMRDLQSKLARETNRLTGWRGPVFERRYEMTVVTEEDRAQIERLAYVLSQSVKEGLVERVRQWPGVHSAAALIDGLPLAGHWLDRTREYAARNQRMEMPPQFATEESVLLTPIPCWAHLPPEVYRARVAAMVADIETEAALARSLKGLAVLGVEAILAKDPQHRPASLARSPAPLVHAATKAVRKAFYDAYAWFVAAFRDAAERLRQGDRDAPFPSGSFPPALPFVAG
jgi:hypothetical protein